MMKKAMAIMLAAVMLLQPVMASAVTWGAVVGTINTLRENGIELETEVEENGEGTGTKVTVTGDKVEIKDGTITGVHIDDGTAGDYTFINVEVDGEVFTIHMNTESASVTISENSKVAVGEVSVTAVGSGEATFVNEGTIDAEWVSIRAFDGGDVTAENNKEIIADRQLVIGADSINEETGEYGNKATASFTNSGEISGSGWEDEEGNYLVNELHVFARGDSEVTVTNTETGEINAIVPITSGNGDWEGNREQTAPEDAEYSLTFTNEGIVNGGVNVSTWENGTTITTNSGEISGYLATDVHENTESSLNNEGVVGEYIQSAAESGVVNVTNSGETNEMIGWSEGSAQVNVTITEEGSAGNVWIDAYDNGTTSVSNSGTVGDLGGGAENGTLIIENAGTVDNFSSDVVGEGTVNMTNSGTVNNEMFVGAFDNGTMEATNSGTVANLYSSANGSGAANVTNEGTVSGDTWFDAMGDSSVTVSNTGTFENGIGGGADEGASLAIENSGTVNGQIYSEGWGEANVTVNNTSDGTVDSIWVNGMGSSEVSATNDGTVNGEIGGGVYESGSTVNVQNNSTADSAWVTAMGGGTVNMENNGTVTNGMGVSTDGASTLNTAGGKESVVVNEIYIETGSDEVLSVEKVAQITANLNLSAGAVMYTVNAEGEINAAFEVDENGNVTLVGAAEEKKEEPVDNGPSPEMIRHWMEELRKKQAIGGVYGSPYWLKQLYLGYHSLELRLYENGERELFKEMLSWYEGGPQKRLTLRVNVENPQDLTMRLDGEVIDILERCEFAVITLQDKNKNVIMEYNVADLKAARSLYGLARTDLLCVGDADAEVMKIGADGKMVPVEEKAAE